MFNLSTRVEVRVAPASCGEARVEESGNCARNAYEIRVGDPTRLLGYWNSIAYNSALATWERNATEMLTSALTVLVTAGVLAAPGPFGPFNGTLVRTADGREIAHLQQGTGAMPRDPSRENGGQDHATFLAALPSGELLMAWFSGQMESEDPMHIAIARLPPNGTQWEPTTIIPQTVQPDYSNQNPVLLHDPQTGLLHLFHPSQYVGEGQGNSTVVMLTRIELCGRH